MSDEQIQRPHFDYKPPALDNFAITMRQRELAERYTRIRWAYEESGPDSHTSWLVVGNQYFFLAQRETTSEASWFCWMMAKAIENLLVQENDEFEDEGGECVFSPFSYSDALTPSGYHCRECGATGVRLYRDYQTFLEHQRLLCRACALRDQGVDGDAIDQREHSIKWLVVAIPTEDGSTFWGYTSVPQAGVDWWDALPKSVALEKDEQCQS